MNDHEHQTHSHHNQSAKAASDSITVKDPVCGMNVPLDMENPIMSITKRHIISVQKMS